jgi:hypothetical protein
LGQDFEGSRKRIRKSGLERREYAGTCNLLYLLHDIGKGDGFK